MTKLDKPLKREVVTLNGTPIIVEIVPADMGLHAHIKFRVPGAHRSFFTHTIEPPPANGGNR